MNGTGETAVTDSPLNLEQAVGQMLLAAFNGYSLPAKFKALLAQRHLGGVTLFRSMNVQNPVQVRELTASLQSAALEGGQPTLLIGADQEGGTLVALAGTTPFPGNLALGATRSPELARRMGQAIGLELAAMGINVNYAPVCDVNINPRNPVIGPRSFGEDPALVATLAAAVVEGLQEHGVAATPKHFPGHGDTSGDSHHSLPVLQFGEERLRSVELPPFAAAIQAGAKLVMTAHLALPALNDGFPVPSTLSAPVLRGLLRRGLGFEGVIVTDALNMGAITQGQGLIIDAIAACNAGADLLMLMDYEAELQSVYAGILQATQHGLLSYKDVQASAERILKLKSWIAHKASQQPGLEVVACAEHLALAGEIAAAATTLVRNANGLLPLKLNPEERILAILPRPKDLTPADTSSFEKPQLGEALRRYHPHVDEVTVSLDPSPQELAALREQASGYSLVVVGTINAMEHTGQADLVNGLLDAGTNLVAVALRLPYDLQAYPGVSTYLCTYSLQPASLHALADALWGHIECRGVLPVTVEGG